MKFGDIVRHIGWLNEGAIFMYLAPAESPWAWAVCLVGDLNNFYEGKISRVNAALELVP